MRSAMPDSSPDFAAKRVMITCAPNGARRSRVDHPELPVTAEQLACDARALLDEQVAILHLHVRDRNGAHSLDPDHYREAIRAIRKAVGTELLIQVTTEAVGRYSPQQQMDMVRTICPEAVSLALSELCPDRSHEAEAARFYAFLAKENIWPQHILYAPSEVRRFDELRKRGLFSDEHPYCQLVLGSYVHARDGNVAELEKILSAADCREFPWAVCCFGQNEHEVMLEATAAGGHVRLGFENNLWLADGSLARNNAQLVRRYLAAMADNGRVPASAGEIRSQFLTRF